ncbi:hypothetical protein WA1_50260 [Scytonema hofmannii PCC 7110]|uniref:Uncharacterized protein n=1 Tax=Scytonema hofmannii PCC 7110 TaxID=128403 RepID=A0A139WR51_9CYAN|nr:hypothetical protein [Scytonema hofmannii]KYC34911.1 hypothetical protein WA1_50260 [Scytonema hofmannii PCC 7110]
MNFHFQICGIWFSNASGNCFSPAVQFKGWSNGTKSITIRSKICCETTVWYRNGKFWWNSDHIARRWGKYIPGEEEKGYPDLFEYRGILGHHQSL